MVNIDFHQNVSSISEITYIDTKCENLGQNVVNKCQKYSILLLVTPLSGLISNLIWNHQVWNHFKNLTKPETKWFSLSQNMDIPNGLVWFGFYWFGLDKQWILFQHLEGYCKSNKCPGANLRNEWGLEVPNSQTIYVQITITTKFVQSVQNTT